MEDFTSNVQPTKPGSTTLFVLTTFSPFDSSGPNRTQGGRGGQGGRMPLLPVVTLKQKVIPPKGGKSSAIDLEERERDIYIY